MEEIKYAGKMGDAYLEFNRPSFLQIETTQFQQDLCCRRTDMDFSG